MKDAVSFKVSSKGVIINLNPEKKIISIINALKKHVSEAKDFFAGVDIYVNMSGSILSAREMTELMEILKSYEKVNEIFFLNEKVKSKERTMDTILIDRTIRSGQSVKYPANIVINGDINPGAEAIAGGDILVMGRIRGVVHAGARGLVDSQIIALDLQPTQLRIASIIARSPDDNKLFGQTKSLNPERAYIKDGVILVEELDNK